MLRVREAERSFSEQEESDGTGEPFIVEAAFQAASLIEKKARRGAVVLSRAAYRAALGIQHVVNRMERQTARTGVTGVQIGLTARQRPSAIVLAGAFIGFALGRVVKPILPQRIRRRV